MDKQVFPLSDEKNGYWSGVVAEAKAGDVYKFQLDGGDAFPDPASRFQPEGPHGPSQIVSPDAFPWTDQSWRGRSIEGQVIYEIHVGTFTPEGTWASAAQQLAELANIGITVIEIMPIADFAGAYGWGYDGVDLFAPTRLYGEPDDLRQFINQAHKLGLSVILDVVYNHFGPDGNYLSQFTKSYFSETHTTDWGEAINYDGPNSGPVREFVRSNAHYWIDEYHFDGLRLDATQNIYDDSKLHILTEVTDAVREAARGRATIVVAENEPQHVNLVKPKEKGGYGMDGLWNDDFHHSAMVALTGRNEAYYTDYLGNPQEFISAFKYGYLYQGQRYKWQKDRRGKPSFGIPSCAFVTFIQNHDQIANSARGLRVHSLTSPALYKVATAMTLLGPGTPMLFQGQEYAASQPFFYFANHKPELGKLIEKGRCEFLYQWRSIKTGEFDGIHGGPMRARYVRCVHPRFQRTPEERAYV